MPGIELSPNWSPLILVVLLGVACALLFISMRRHLRRMRGNWDADSPSAESEGVDRP